MKNAKQAICVFKQICLFLAFEITLQSRRYKQYYICTAVPAQQ